ncbi:MAG: diacylglycerol kinase family protein [Bacilli bacterium]|nr:diacylglycerol kinase family protein [Bacilli bacterium]
MSVKLKDKNTKLDKKRLRNSFKYAFQGVKQTYLGEQNMKIHTIIAIIVVVCGFIFKISYVEWLICLVLICLVLMAEFFNTSIEYVVDLISPNIHPLAKAAKDTASAGVLMMAIISTIAGLMIFVPKILAMFKII